MAYPPHEKISIQSSPFTYSENRDLEDSQLGSNGSRKGLSGLAEYVSTKIVPRNFAPSLHRTLSFETVLSLLFALLPSYVQSLVIRKPSKGGPSMGIVALDGLRGYACLIVFTHHFTNSYIDPHSDHPFQKMPILRLMGHGRAMVSVFFVISGYVLSHKSLKMLRVSDTESLLKTLASSTFRRAFRLFLPAMIALVFWSLITYLGAFDQGCKVFAAHKPYLFLWTRPPHRLHTLNQQLWSGIVDAYRLPDTIISWTPPAIPGIRYDRNLWTLPTEFKCSMAVFVVLLAASRLRNNVRLPFLLGLVIYSCWTMRYDIIGFFEGVLLAEIDLIMKDYNEKRQKVTNPLPTTTKSDKATSSNPEGSVRFRPVRSILHFIFLWFGIFLLSAPGREDPIIWFLGKCFFPGFVDRYDIVLREISAAFIVWSAIHFSAFNHLLSSSFSLYLGKISFALYIVHGNVIKSIGFAVLPWSYGLVTGLPDAEIKYANFTSKQTLFAWLIGAAFVYPIAFWGADVFWRLVDAPCVRLTRWIEMSLGPNKEEAGGHELSKRRDSLRNKTVEKF